MSGIVSDMIEALPVEAFLEPYPARIREAAERLRAIVRRTVPDAAERVRPGWRLIGYDVPVGRRSRYFAWISPEPIHVHLGFEHGVLMADPDRQLEGAHLRLRKVRYVTFTSLDQIDEGQLAVFLREAVGLASLSRSERLGLILDRD
jgi:hypothetical protein